MKLTKSANLIVFGAILALVAVGCRTKSNYLTKIPQGSSAHGGDSSPGKPLIDDANKVASNDVNKVNSNDVAGTGISDPDKRKDWLRDHEIFKSQTVHFDLDSSVLKEQEKSKVALVADYFKAHALDALEIEGHCDMRGTEEYNRSLGERRALALRDEFIRLGIEPSRVDTLSYGEDRPADPGHDEAAYQKNRRGEFVLEKHQTLVGLNTPQ
jgi:peptidoglycan-associated lipoprotein